MNQQDEDYNPYEAPEVGYSEGNIADSNLEVIRREHLSHEASTQSIGILYFLGGSIVFIASLGLLLAPRFANQAATPTAIIYLFPVLGVLQLVVAYGLRKLKSWARIPAGLISGLGLFAFPIGTLINLYILYLIFSPKGRMVFSSEYRTIIDQTPHIKYQTSIIVKIFLFLLLAIILLGVVAAFFTAR